MIKKIVLSYLLFITISFAFASPPVDPEKKDKEQKKESEEITISEELKTFEGKDLPLPINEEPQIKDNKESSEDSAQGEDVQSFNFLYYIIHHFKFSDFITQ